MHGVSTNMRREQENHATQIRLSRFYPPILSVPDPFPPFPHEGYHHSDHAKLCYYAPMNATLALFILLSPQGAGARAAQAAD